MRFSLLLTAVLVLTLPVRSGQAQDPGYEGFITEALQAYDAGRWAEARTLFHRAHDVEPTARTYRTIGMCSFNLGDYRDALLNLEAALADERKPLTPEQRAQVSDLITHCNAKLGRFRLQLSPQSATLQVDGSAPTLLGQRELLLEPGRHQISASASGHRTLVRELSVEGGDHATLELRLEPGVEERAGVAAPAPGTATAPEPMTPAATTTAGPSAATRAPAEAHPGSSTRAILGYIGLGVGAAGIATFAITGGLALAKKSKLASECPKSQCRPAHYVELDSYDRLKTISTIGLISGAVLLSAGAVLLLTGGGDASPEHAALVPALGLGWAGVRGQL
jgi:hypothetical protein